MLCALPQRAVQATTDTQSPLCCLLCIRWIAMLRLDGVAASALLGCRRELAVAGTSITLILKLQLEPSAEKRRRNVRFIVCARELLRMFESLQKDSADFRVMCEGVQVVRQPQIGRSGSRHRCRHHSGGVRGNRGSEFGEKNVPSHNRVPFLFVACKLCRPPRFTKREGRIVGQKFVKSAPPR